MRTMYWDYAGDVHAVVHTEDGTTQRTLCGWIVFDDEEAKVYGSKVEPDPGLPPAAVTCPPCQQTISSLSAMNITHGGACRG